MHFSGVISKAHQSHGRRSRLHIVCKSQFAIKRIAHYRENRIGMGKKKKNGSACVSVFFRFNQSENYFLRLFTAL